MVFYKHLLAFASCALLATSASAAFVINEVDADTPGSDALEYVELLGSPNESVAGLTLIVYNGTGTTNAAPRAKAAYDLTGNADANGYYVIGDANVTGVDLVIPNGTIENGEDAVGLYSGTSAAAITATNAAGATSPANAPGTLIDHCIWESGTDNTPNWTPFSTTAVDEAAAGEPDQDSISRIPNGTGPFTLGKPSPKAANIALPEKELSAPVIVDFGRSNKATITTRTVTLRNNGSGNLTVNALALAGGSDAEFSIVAGPDPVLPAVLARNQGTSVVLQFSNADVAASQVFNAGLSYTTDDPTSSSGTIPVIAEFVKVLQTASTGAVVINEFCSNPNAGAANGGIQDYNGDGILNANSEEFTELYNTTASPINIQGWELSTTNGPTNNFTVSPFVFPLGTTLPANGHVVVFNAGTPTGFPAGVAFTDGPGLSNAGATIQIHDGTTRIDGIAYGETVGAAGYTSTNLLSVGGSIGRSPDGSGNIIEFKHNLAVLSPSPGATNPVFTAASDWQMFE